MNTKKFWLKYKYIKIHGWTQKKEGEIIAYRKNEEI